MNHSKVFQEEQVSGLPRKKEPLADGAGEVFAEVPWQMSVSPGVIGVGDSASEQGQQSTQPIWSGSLQLTFFLF